MAFTKSTVSTNNVQGLADQVKNQAAVVKQTMDKYAIDDKQFTNDHIDELEATTASGNIGHDGSGFAGATVKDALVQAKTELDGVVVGMVPPGTANYFLKTNAGATDVEWSDIPNQNTTNISTNATDIDLLQNTISYGTTVSGTDALTITTVNGGFTFAVGKSVRGIAVNNNTTSMTANIDADGALPIKKLDSSSYIDVEADDFEDNKPFELICQTDGVIGDFFLLAPKSGAKFFKNITNSSWFDNPFTGTSLTLIHSVIGSGWIFCVGNPVPSSQNYRLTIDGDDSAYSGSNGVNPFKSLAPEQHECFIYRYKTGFNFYGPGFGTIAYAIDDGSGDISKSTPGFYTNEGTGTTILETTIVGPGYFEGIPLTSSSGAMKIQIDGVNIINDFDIGAPIFCLWRFNSQLRIYSELANRYARYVLDN